MFNITEIFPNGGYYVEAGAHDGIGGSHTYVLEQSGKWQGICVEPSSAFTGLCKHRKCHVDNRCLWKISGQKITFREIIGNAIELSGILETFGDTWDRENRPYRDLQKITVSLTDLLLEYKAPATIEFLSLDTEGSEYDILSTHDFNKFLFAVILVEHNGVIEKRKSIRELLKEHGYQITLEEEINDYYCIPTF